MHPLRACVQTVRPSRLPGPSVAWRGLLPSAGESRALKGRLCGVCLERQPLGRGGGSWGHRGPGPCPLFSEPSRQAGVGKNLHQAPVSFGMRRWPATHRLVCWEERCLLCGGRQGKAQQRGGRWVCFWASSPSFHLTKPSQEQNIPPLLVGNLASAWGLRGPWGTQGPGRPSCYLLSSSLGRVFSGAAAGNPACRRCDPLRRQPGGTPPCRPSVSRR